MTYFDAPYRPADLTLNSDAINSSLVGFWPLTDGSGTTAKDISGVGSNLTSPSTPLWGSSSIGPAYTSNGIDHQAYLNTNNGFPISSVDAFSVSFWYESDASGSYGDFLGDWSGGSEKNLLIRNNLECYVRNAGDTAEDGIQAVFPFGSPFNVAGAYHIVLVIDSGNAKLFINGSLNNQDTSFMAGPYIAGNDNLKIGRGFNQSMQSGFLNNVRIFNAALTATQVEQLYTRPWTGTNYDTEALWLSPPASPTLSTASEATSLMSGCQAWYPLTEGAGTTATCIMGHSAHNGTLDTGVTWETSERGTAAKFDGTSNSKITLGSEPVSGQTISISTWFYSESTDNFQAIYCSTPNTKNYLLYSGNNQSVAWDQYPPSGGGANSAVNSALRGRWNHAVVTQDATTAKIYVNGELEATFTAEVYSGTATTFYIGYRRPNQRMTGSIQNLRVWDRVLSANEAQLLYERPWIGAEYNESFYLYPPVPSSLTPLDSSNSILVDQVGWWPLTETDDYASGAADISGNGNNGTQSGGVLSEFGELGTVASFDGSDDGITGTFSLASQDLTVSFWANWEDYGTSTVAFAFGGFKENLEVHFGGIGVNGVRFIPYQYDGGTPSNYATLDCTSMVQAGWNHYTFTAEKTGYSNAYLNGVLFATSSTTGAAATSLALNQDFNIGIRDETPWYRFKGDISNVRVWSRALSATEVADIYYSPWLGSAYTGTSSDPATNRYFSPAAFARLG